MSLDETAVCIVGEDGIVVRETNVASEPNDGYAWMTAAGVMLTHLGLEAGPLSRIIELLTEQPRLLALVRPMLAARQALRQQHAIPHRMVLGIVRSDTCVGACYRCRPSAPLSR